MNGQTMNHVILAKREETAKLIQIEHEKIFKKHDIVKDRLDEVRRRVKYLKEKTDTLTHINILLIGENIQISSNINEVQAKLIAIECQVDGVLVKQSQTNMVKDKEVNTLKIYCNKIMEKAKINEQFWIDSVKKEELNELNRYIKTLQDKKVTLEMHIDLTKEKIIGLNASKLAEGCMILRKRNTAIQKRLVRKLKVLKDQLEKVKKQSVKTN